MMERGRKTCIY